MKKNKLRVVHFVNQFFGGKGGEDKAGQKPQKQDGIVGPGGAIQNELGESGEVVGTIICGDNYFVENIERATKEVIKLIEEFEPDGLIAGPAFNAGRYGIACGAVCKAVNMKLKIPSVTGMFNENPGRNMFCENIYIAETDKNVKGMSLAVSRMVNIMIKLNEGVPLGKPSVDGYFPRGIIVNEKMEDSAAVRAVNMLLLKMLGGSFKTEIPFPQFEKFDPAPSINELNKANIALLTDGGIVPKGNPDGIETDAATKYGSYQVNKYDYFNSDDYEISHGGYDKQYVLENVNRLIPVDVMQEIEKEGKIGNLHEYFYSTSGCGSLLHYSQEIGRKIARSLKNEGVDGAILTST